MDTITAQYVDGAGFRGHAGILEYFARMSDVAERVHVDIEEVRDLGDRVLALGRWQMHGRQSGIEFGSRGGWLGVIRDDKIVVANGYSEPTEAVEAARMVD